MPGTHASNLTGSETAELEEAARAVLDDNWLGASTVPSPGLYPHQWSWDSAFVAIERSWYDQQRAQTELETLFAAQWANGMLPTSSSIPRSRRRLLPGPRFLAEQPRQRRSPGHRDLRDHPAATARGGRPGGLPARRRPWPSWSGCTPGWPPSTPTCGAGGTRTGAGPPPRSGPRPAEHRQARQRPARSRPPWPRPGAAG